MIQVRRPLISQLFTALFQPLEVLGAHLIQLRDQVCDLCMQLMLSRLCILGLGPTFLDLNLVLLQAAFEVLDLPLVQTLVHRLIQLRAQFFALVRLLRPLIVEMSEVCFDHLLFLQHQLHLFRVFGLDVSHLGLKLHNFHFLALVQSVKFGLVILLRAQESVSLRLQLPLSLDQLVVGLRQRSLELRLLEDDVFLESF